MNLFTHGQQVRTYHQVWCSTSVLTVKRKIAQWNGICTYRRVPWLTLKEFAGAWKCHYDYNHCKVLSIFHGWWTCSHGLMSCNVLEMNILTDIIICTYYGPAGCKLRHILQEIISNINIFIVVCVHVITDFFFQRNTRLFTVTPSILCSVIALHTFHNNWNVGVNRLCTTCLDC